MQNAKIHKSGRYSSEFKEKVALEALSGAKTHVQIASKLYEEDATLGRRCMSVMRHRRYCIMISQKKCVKLKKQLALRILQYISEDWQKVM